MQRVRRVRQQIAVLVHRAALGRRFRPQRGERLLQSGGAVDDQELGRRSPRATRSSSTPRQAASLSPPMLRTASRIFCPSRRMPSTTRSEMLVALRSSRTRTTLPSRISRTTSSCARSRRVQASQKLWAAGEKMVAASSLETPTESAPCLRLSRTT